MPSELCPTRTANLPLFFFSIFESTATEAALKQTRLSRNVTGSRDARRLVRGILLWESRLRDGYPYMGELTDNTKELISKAKAGDLSAVSTLFEKYRHRLRRIIEFRIDPRLQSRLDASDVLQEVYVDVHNRIHEFQEAELSFFLWLRLKIGHRLTDLHRFHMRHKRHAGREISLTAGMPAASSVSLAMQLLGQLTSASEAAIREEDVARVQTMLNQMDDTDREVIVMRHFEDLTNAEISHLLGISQNAASNRYVRALKKLSTEMSRMGYSATAEDSAS